MNVRSSIRSVLRRSSAEVRRLAREEAGVALMVTLGVFLLLYILCCGVYATGEIVRQRIQIQNACDAAAYSAAVVQADALSRMAVVNRAMAWTYIQLCREQMDYIVFSWLKLTCDRFEWDRDNKAAYKNDFDTHQHFTFGYKFDNKYNFDLGVVRVGLHDFYSRHDNIWYCGVGETLAQRKQEKVSLNGRNSFAQAEKEADIRKFVDGLGGKNWKRGMEKGMGDLKEAIFGLNATLGIINMEMTKSISATAQYVLFQNLPKGEQGKVEESTAKDFYWTVVGGVGGIPLAYSGEVGGADPMGSYFEGLFNTEEDEIQFLQMADGLPGQKAGAPGWMKDGNRPVVLSDYFGTPGHPVQAGMGKIRFAAGGLDQWYVRGPSEEAMHTGPSVPKQFHKAPPGGIQRVYKHTNREEGETLGKYLRPNHIFSWTPVDSMFGQMDLNGQFGGFMNPGRILPGKLLSKLGGFVSTLGNLANKLAGGGIIGQIGKFASFSFDLPPSDEHALNRYPDQCRNVNESTGLVSQYEWSSAYWMCPWIQTRRMRPPFNWRPPQELGHYRLPVAALEGCSEHGYDPWLSTEFDILMEGKTARADYRSCFINLDDTQDMDFNHYLKGYARIYGDDAEIFNEVGYVGQVARPWILGKSFFSGDGTILVGLARRQKNPFMRMLSWGSTRDGARPSLYEPFSPQPGRDRFLVGLSAARAAWAPRPDRPVTGMESMNAVEGQPAPGNYEPRWDEVTDHKFEIEGGGLGGTRFGCVCGKMPTHERLKRMWNLSQTDWDATLLPLRHAYCEHSPYDSYRNLTDGSFWEYKNENENAVSKMMGILMGKDVTWKNGAELLKGQASSQWNGSGRNVPPSLSTSDILAFPTATGVPLEKPESPYRMFLYRRLL